MSKIEVTVEMIELAKSLITEGLDYWHMPEINPYAYLIVNHGVVTLEVDDTVIAVVYTAPEPAPPTNSNMEAWTIKQLAEAMEKDLLACHTEHERIMVKAICGKEIREKAEEFSKQRKLTPCEVAIASKYGYKPS